MKNLLKDVSMIVLALLLTGASAYAMQPPEVVQPVKNPVKTVDSNDINNQSESAAIVEVVEQAPIPEVVQTPPPAPKPVPTPPAVAEPTIVQDNETVIWNFLINKGFTRNQAAGIMGNLQQEHNFQTSDSDGGLGIAQWIGGRRARLVAQGDHTNINVQLNFLVDELDGVEAEAGVAIRAAVSVEGSVLAFQNKFERCGNCMQHKRVIYAYAILNRH
jgi:hypothetical protein